MVFVKTSLIEKLFICGQCSVNIQDIGPVSPDHAGATINGHFALYN